MHLSINKDTKYHWFLFFYFFLIKKIGMRIYMNLGWTGLGWTYDFRGGESLYIWA